MSIDKDEVIVWWHDVAKQNQLMGEPFASMFSYLHKDRSIRQISPIHMFDTIDEALSEKPWDFLERDKRR